MEHWMRKIWRIHRSKDGSVRLELFSRLWLIRCAPRHPHRWMIVWTDAIILPADLDQGFLEAILDNKELDERRHPSNVWKTKGKPE